MAPENTAPEKVTWAPENTAAGKAAVPLENCAPEKSPPSKTTPVKSKSWPRQEMWVSSGPTAVRSRMRRMMVCRTSRSAR
ncbi:hypothetical protein [Streptomyces sp. PA5.6]|uniref:hypothetical protein n=1 Tax=Streptomyces sp. PA5.6 TaxID=3035651 RepID=UPI003904D63D